jgi:hypothetical protein
LNRRMTELLGREPYLTISQADGEDGHHDAYSGAIAPIHVGSNAASEGAGDCVAAANTKKLIVREGSSTFRQWLSE